MTNKLIDIDKLQPSPFNRRREWGNIDELAASIKTDGILEPILVRARIGGSYELIAGERRLKAAQLCELASVPAIILEATDEEAMRISAVENLQRENPHPLDETESYMRPSEGEQSEHGAGHCGAGRETSSLHLPDGSSSETSTSKCVSRSSGTRSPWPMPNSWRAWIRSSSKRP